MSSEPKPWWSLWLSHEDIDGNAGRAWLTADQIDQAEHHLARQLTTNTGYHRDHALFASELAHTRLRAGDVTGACEATNTALTAIEHIETPRVRARLDTAISTLRDRYPDHPKVAELMNS